MQKLALTDSSLDKNETQVEEIQSCVAEASREIKTKGLNKDYEFECTFPNLIEAKKAIEDKKISAQFWTRGASYTTNNGDKICFTCKGFPKCPRRLYILLDPESQDAHIFISNDQHDHSSTSSRSHLNARSRSKVIELLELGVETYKKF